jgi:6-phosphogluconolactonase
MRRFCLVSNRQVTICRDAEQLYRAAAAQFVALAGAAAPTARGFAVALSGGSTPKGLYTLLATPEYREQIPWSRVHLFWGDERCVPPDHSESNYRMVRESLLSKIDIPQHNIHRMAGEKDPEIAAAEYELELSNFFQLSEGDLPRFDLILLGLGEDGHTASLFPGSKALERMKHLVAAVDLETLGRHRLTLTLPVLNNGAQIAFLVSGRSKAAILGEILGTKSRSSILPAAKVQPDNGRITWLVTRDAAAGLELH